MSEIADALRNSRVPFDSRSHERIDASPGLYAFWLRGTCLYVGMSEDLRRRIYQHENFEDNPELDRHFKAYPHEIEISVAYKDADSVILRRLEQEAIRELNPLANVQRDKP